MNKALCNLCKPLFEGEVNIDKEWDEDQAWGMPKHARPHHDSISELAECGQNRCLLCAALWTSIAQRQDKEKWFEPDRLPQSDPQISVAVNLDPSEGVRTFTIRMVVTKCDIEDKWDITFYAAEPDSQHLEQQLLLRPAEKFESTASTRSMEWVRGMVQECTSGHEKCNNTPTSWLPSRLIHLGGPSQMPRLVELGRMLPGPDTSPAIKYTTLSHCWGSVDMLKLTTENRFDLKKGIPPSNIPKTYMEAMETTKSLGLEYIWIDSLCIIQDDPDDWQRECTEMAEVYRHGHCNIAALEAADSHGGCFRQRDPAHIAPVIVETKWEGQNRRLWVRKAFPDRYAIFHEIEDSPLQRRAWVLQERHMAPRVLHFGQKAIFWECRTVTGCESGDVFKTPSLIGYNALNATAGSKDEVGHILWIWSSIVSRYTHAALTFKSDRFIAISAVARETQRILSYRTTSNVEYLAGLWTILLEYQLMWYPAFPDTATRISEVDQLTAPSWSWASLNGPVSAHLIPWVCDSQVPVARVLRHRIVPRSNDPFFGPEMQSKSVLEISGLFWRLADPTRNERHCYPPTSPITISLHWDTTSPLPSVGTANFLLPVVFDRPSKSYPRVPAHKGRFTFLAGLILQKVDDSTTRSFQRIGIFYIGVPSDSPCFDGEGWRTKLDSYIELSLEQNIIWPSQYGDHPPQSTPAHKIRAKAKAYQTIFLE